MKEAMLYEQKGHAMVQCHVCPHNCVIPEGKTGFCGIRKNIGGKLYAITYAKVASIAIDPIEKKPLYHFYPGSPVLSLGTFGCNMRCKHCQNWEISHHGADENSDDLYDLSPADAVQMAIDRGCEILAWTYNEPSIWFEYILDTSKLAREAGIKTALITAGMIEPPALKALLNYVDAYRLDVKGFTEQFYERLTGSAVLKSVLENGIIAWHTEGVHLEIITNVIPNWNDTDAQFDGLSRWIRDNLSVDVPWHVTAYHPDNLLTEPPTPVATLERAKAIGHSNGLKYIYVGNIPGHEGQNTVCPGCEKVLIDRVYFGIGENHIVEGKCEYCGYRIEVYSGHQVPMLHHTNPYPRLIL